VPTSCRCLEKQGCDPAQAQVAARVLLQLGVYFTHKGSGPLCRRCLEQSLQETAAALVVLPT
jgi:hypothetical protein